MFNLEKIQSHYQVGEGPTEIVSYPSENLEGDFAIFRCTVDQMMSVKETEKAIGIDIRGDRILHWLPKSVILDWVHGKDTLPTGFAVKRWFADKEAYTLGPFWFRPFDPNNPDHAHDAKTLLQDLKTAGAKADEATVERILSLERSGRRKIWKQLWDHIRGTYRNFDDYYVDNTARAHSTEHKETAKALARIRIVLGIE